MTTQYGRPAGFDMARQVEVGHKGITFEYLEEAFTSEHWIIRIYKRHPPHNRDGHAFAPVDATVDRFGRRGAALPGGAVRPRKHLPLWTPGGASASSAAAKPAVRYVGCYKRETSFGEDRKYAGSTTGAYIGLARAHAVTSGKRFVAVARLGGDGHAFAFNAPITDPEASGGGCDRACLDDKDYACGCSDAACTESPDPGDDNVRRWAVYEVVAEGSGGSGSGGGSGTGSGGGRRSGRKAGGSK